MPKIVTPETVMPTAPTASFEAPDHRQVTDLSDGAAAVAVASMHAMGSGALADFESLYTEDAVNRESATEPPDTRARARPRCAQPHSGCGPRSAT